MKYAVRNLYLSLLLASSFCGFTQIPTAGLIGYWPFDGDANDMSVIQNHGIVNGAKLTADRFGNLNSAYHFDGASSITNSSVINGDVPFTISCWVKVA